MKVGGWVWEGVGSIGGIFYEGFEAWDVQMDSEQYFDTDARIQMLDVSYIHQEKQSIVMRRHAFSTESMPSA